MSTESAAPAPTTTFTDAQQQEALSGATPEHVKAAFTEWHRRWVEDPGAFWSEQESLASDDSSYGGACTPYFLSILREVQAA